LDDLDLIHLHKKDAKVKRIVFFTFFIPLFVFSVLMTLTIVGIPFAFISIIILAFVWHWLKVYQYVACSKCGFYKNKVSNNDLNFKCKRCNTIHLIEWNTVEQSSM
jgi:phage FluMu protein Com